jgi:iodotyrosine deiodinase
VVFVVRRPKLYYPLESIGIAVGMLLVSLHVAGLATLTHTPSPMRFLNRILDRPPEEKPVMIVAVGWPAPEAEVPDITKKPLDEVLVWR